MNDRDFYTSEEIFSLQRSEKMSHEMMYTTVALGVALAASVIFLLACCVIRRKKKPDKAVVKEGYSVAVDSVSVRQYEHQHYHYAEYVLPEDALSATRAQHRYSMGEGEYDTLTRNFKQRMANTGHVYSHVTLSPKHSTERKSSSSESPYDVAPYIKSPIVTVSKDDSAGEMYGHVTIRSNPIEVFVSDD